MNEQLASTDQSGLLQLLSLTIPKASGQPDGFLEIAGIAHRENVNSRIYAHFLNSHHSGVRSSFLNALLELVTEKSGKSIDIQSCVALLENATDKNCRIDLLIKDHGNQSAIVIENKIYHHLDNDLLHYWDHVPCKEENKVGVLLTLEPHTIPEEVAGKFVNITHNEWIGRIRQNGLPMDIPANYYHYITDFANTIDRLTKSYTMNEQARFYFQHAPKVIEAKNTMDQAYGFLEDQLNILAGKLGWSTYGSAIDWKNFWDAENELHTYLTVYYGPIINGELNCQIILELMNEDQTKMGELEPLLIDSPQYQQMHRGESTKRYVHFGVRDYTLTMAELEHFGEHLYQLVLRDFAATLLTIIRHYYPHVNISKWASNFEPRGIE